MIFKKRLFFYEVRGQVKPLFPITQENIQRELSLIKSEKTSPDFFLPKQVIQKKEEEFSEEEIYSKSIERMILEGARLLVAKR